MGGFWEAKILHFPILFDVFSMSFFKRGSEGEKIEQKCEKTKLFRFLASGLRWSPTSWGKDPIALNGFGAVDEAPGPPPPAPFVFRENLLPGDLRVNL